MHSNENELYTARPGSFFGVYILYNLSSKRKGAIYIGFTVNPSRRIRQHNREITGGAAKTGRICGPWDMVLITHGFHTRLAALQFEWAWQNPGISRRLSHLQRKRQSSKETIFSYRLRILSEMLNTGPWNRLPLTIQWLKQEYYQDFPINRPPPVHMPIAYGEIKTVKKQDTKDKRDKEQDKKCGINNRCKTCMICMMMMNEEDEVNKTLNCIVSSCDFTAHTKCLAETFLTQSTNRDNFLLPVYGCCPSCKQELLWSDMIKQKRYSLEDIEFDENQDDESEFSQGVSSSGEDEFQ